MTLSLAWYVIPTVITILALGWAFFWPADRGGMFSGVTTMLMLIPALVVIAIAWIAAAIFK